MLRPSIYSLIPKTLLSIKSESESKLWIASKEYLLGDINVEQLEEIEIPYVSNFKAATLALAKSQMRIFIIMLIVFGFLITITVGILISLISKNWLPLAICATPLIFARVIEQYVFPLDERRFKIQSEKIRMREQKNSKIRGLG
jgi:hypothetical protein